MYVNLYVPKSGGSVVPKSDVYKCSDPLRDRKRASRERERAWRPLERLDCLNFNGLVLIRVRIPQAPSIVFVTCLDSRLDSFYDSEMEE